MDYSIPLFGVDFFCGAGGMSYGLGSSGITMLGGVDIDPSCKETYEANNERFIEADITKLSPLDLGKRLGIQRSMDNLVLVGCSPCQYWSKINTDRYKSAVSKNLLRDFGKFVDHFRPGYVIVENVPGIASKAGNHVLLDFLDRLNLLGYTAERKVISVSQYGVPQLRKRFLLVATRLGNNAPYPLEEYNDSLTVRNFIGSKHDFPAIESGAKDTTDFLHTCSRLSEKNIRRLELTPSDGGTRMAWKDHDDLQLNAYRGKDNIFKDVYGRMYWDRPAPTITTRFNSISNGRFAHPEENRGLSLREGATLQTFPRDYVFRGTENGIAKQVGNAVPPELGRRIGQSILEHWKEWQNLERKHVQSTTSEKVKLPTFQQL